MLDVGLQGACTGALCCAPGCQITIRDFHGCDLSVVFAGTCQDRFKNPTATLHPPTSACDDVQVTQLLDPDGNPSYDLYHKPSKTYDRYKFFNCGQPSAGGQCTVTGGGCVCVDPGSAGNRVEG
jgi:hypothetical protein